MNEKLKINLSIEELKSKGQLWQGLVFSTIVSSMEEKRSLKLAKKVEGIYDNERATTVTALAELVLYTKVITGIQFLILTETHTGQFFNRVEFMEALVYNSQILSEVAREILGNKQASVETAMKSLFGGRLPGELEGMLSSIITKGS